MKLVRVFSLYQFFLLVAVQGDVPVIERVKFLEVQVSHESAKTGTDLGDLRSDLDTLNNTLHRCECSANIGDQPPDFKPGTGLMTELQHLLTSQKQTAGAIKTAFSEQKRLQRKEFGSQNKKLNTLSEQVRLLNNTTECISQDVLSVETRITQNEINTSRIQEKTDDLGVMSKALHEQVKTLTVNVTSQLESLNTFRTDLDDTKRLVQRVAPVLTGIRNRLTKLEHDNENVTNQMKAMETKINALTAFSSCERPWIIISGACYMKVEYKYRKYEGAQSECRKFGGRLAEPNTYNKMLQTLDTWKSKSTHYFIGVVKDKAGTFKWASSGEPFTTSFWGPGEPNNMGGIENCVSLKMGYLNDCSCDVLSDYICEKLFYMGF